MAEPLEAELELSIADALSQIDSLGPAIDAELSTAGDSLADSISGALAALDTQLVLDFDTSNVEPEAEAALAGIDTQLSLDLALDTTDAEAQLNTLEAEAAVPLAMTADLDTGDAEAQLTDLGGAASDAATGLGDASSQASGFGNAAGIAAASAGIARGQVGGLTNVLGGMSTSMKTGIGVGTAFAATLGVMYEKGVNSMASIQRLDATLGEFRDDIDSIDVGSLHLSFTDLATATGSSERAMRNATSTIFQMATASGAGGKEAESFSEKILALAGRAVALNPAIGDVGSVADQMGVRLARGGRFALKFGMDLTATEINMRALRDTGKTSIAELSQYEKAAAAATIAVEKYGDSLGGKVKDGADNAIIVQRRLKLEFEGILATLGRTIVIPIFDLIDAGMPIIQAFADVVVEVGKSAIPVMTGALEAVTPALQLVADLLKEIPGPILAVGAAAIGMKMVFGGVGGIVTSLGSHMAQLSTFAGTTGGKMAIAAGGALVAADGFQRVGQSAADSAIGIGEMAVGGAALGFQIGALTPAGPIVGAAIGAVAGAAVGAAKAMLDGGEGVEEYRDKFRKLGTDLDKMASGGALKKFLDTLGDVDRVLAAGSSARAISGITDEVEALATTSPKAAQKVVDAFIKMHEEAGKPLSHAAIDELQGAVDKGTAAFQKHVIQQQKADAGNAALAASAMLAAQAETNRTTAEKASADAMTAHATAIAQATSKYQELTLAAQGQAAADANTIAVAQQVALSTRSAADAQAAVAQEGLAAQIAYDGAASAAYRYADGTGTAKEMSDALATAVGVLNTQLDLLLGRFLTADQQSNNLELALMGINDELAKNGFSFAENTKEGLANQNALDGVAEKAISASAAILQSTGNVTAAKQPLIDLRGTVQGVRDSLAAQGADTTFLDTLLGHIDAAIAGVGAKKDEAQAADSEMASGVPLGVAEVGPAVRTAGSAVGRAAVDGVRDWISGGGTAGSELGEAARAAVAASATGVRSSGAAVGAAAVDGVKSWISGAATAGSDLGEGSGRGVESKRGRHHEAGSALGAGVSDGVKSKGGDVASSGGDIAAKGANAAGGRYGAYYDAGASSAAGLEAGILSFAGRVATAGASIAQAALDGVHGIIRNPPYPSQAGVELGQSLGSGIALGIESETSYVVSVAEAVVRQAQAAAMALIRTGPGAEPAPSASGPPALSAIDALKSQITGDDEEIQKLLTDFWSASSDATRSLAAQVYQQAVDAKAADQAALDTAIAARQEAAAGVLSGNQALNDAMVRNADQIQHALDAFWQEGASDTERQVAADLFSRLAAQQNEFNNALDKAIGNVAKAVAPLPGAVTGPDVGKAPASYSGGGGGGSSSGAYTPSPTPPSSSMGKLDIDVRVDVEMGKVLVGVSSDNIAIGDVRSEIGSL